MYNKFNYLIWILVASISCTVNEPKLPEWDTKWNIYMPTQDFLMEEVINDSTLISGVDSEGTPIILFNLEDSTEWERIGRDDLYFEPQEDHYSSEIGEINLGNYEDLESDRLTVVDLLPPELQIFGDTLPPYDTMSVTPPTVVLEYDQYKSAHIKEGLLWLTFHNEMFLTIREGLVINVYNENGEMEFIDRAIFNEQIPSGSTVVSDPIDLTDQTIFNKFRLEYIIPLAGSDTTQVLNEERRNGFVYTVLSVNEFIVDQAEAKVPEQSFDDSDGIDVTDEDHKIIHAEIEQGTINFSIDNRLPLDANIEMELPNFRQNDQPKIVNYKLNAFENDVVSIDLSGYEITNYLTPGDIIETIDYNVVATVDSSEDYVLVTAQDSILIDVVTDSFIVSSFAGILDTVDFEIDPTELDEIDFFEDIDGSVRLNDLEMQLTFHNEIDLPIEIDLQIAGYHYEDNAITDSVIIQVHEPIQPLSASPSTLIIIDEDYSNPSIVDLIAILPTEIKVTGNAMAYGRGSVSIGDGLRALYKFQSPLNLEISEPIYYNAEIDSITENDIDDDQRDQIVNDLGDVSAIFDFKNYIPIGMHVKYFMATDSMMLFNDQIPDSSKKIILETDVTAGNVGSDGYVQSAVGSSFSVDLTDHQLDIFNFSPIYTRQEIMIKTTDGFVKVRQADALEVDAVLNFKITVNSEED